MSSLLGNLFKGYNTFWMAVWMIIPTIVLVIIAVKRALDGSGRDWLLAVVATEAVFITAIAQYNVQRVKAVRYLPKSQQSHRFNELASEMSAWVGMALVTAVLLIALAIWFAAKAKTRYDIPWAAAVSACGTGMLGVAMDYYEWQRITVNKSYRYNWDYRFPAVYHYGLSIVTFGLAGLAAVWFLYLWRQYRT